MAGNNSATKDLHQKPPVGATQHSAGAEQKRSVTAKIQGASLEILAKNAAAAVGMRQIIDDISPILAAIMVLADVDDMAGEDIARRLDVIQKLARMGMRTADDIIDLLADERGSMQGELAELEGALT